MRPAPGNSVTASRAANPAPALTPMTLGLAMVLFKTACMRAPDSARAPPASAAAAVRGMRTNSKVRRTGSPAPACRAPSSWARV